MVIELSGDDFVANLADELALLFGEHTQLLVGDGCGLFQESEGMDDFLRHRCGRADGEVVDGALGLGAPITVGRDFDRSHGVGFGSGVHEINKGTITAKSKRPTDEIVVGVSFHVACPCVPEL